MPILEGPRFAREDPDHLHPLGSRERLLFGGRSFVEGTAHEPIAGTILLWHADIIKTPEASR
jgi:hypothetical protein